MKKILTLMIFGLTSDDFSENQIQILKLLFEKEYLQHELQKALSTTGSNLHYHLTKLEKYNLIRKEMLQKIGNARINRISLNPSARQHVRKILGFEVKDYTLITGFGKLEMGYKLPDIIFQILKEKYYPISRIVCFTSPDALKNRVNHEKSENLVKIDLIIKFLYEDYRYIESEFFKKVENILSEEMKSANIIVDLTPLSKLFSFKLLEIANKYFVPCVYLGFDREGKNKLYWMSNMKIDGEIDKFN